MLQRLALAAAMAAATACAQAGENEAVRFAIFRSYTEAIEESCPDYYAYDRATSGGHLTPQDRAAAMAAVPGWLSEMRQNVKQLGCDAAAHDALAFTDLGFQDVWEYKQ